MTESAARRLTELYDLREALEVHAVENVAGELPVGQRRKMQSHIEEMNCILKLAGQHGWTAEYADRWLLADASFHWSLLEACGNQRLLRMMNELEVMPGVFVWRREYVAQVDHRRVVREHEEIVAAVVAGAGIRGAKILVRHIRRGLEVALASIEDATC